MNGMFRTFLNCTNQDNPGYLITKNMVAPSPSFPNQGYLFKNILKWLKSFPTIYQPKTWRPSFMALRSPKDTPPAVVTPKASPTPRVAWASRGSWSSLARPGSPEGTEVRGSAVDEKKASGLFAGENKGWDYDTTPVNVGILFFFEMDFGIGYYWLFQKSQGL